MKLTKRLQYIADRVEDNETFIDVAADHGYLALALAKRNNHRKIIVSDIAKQPLESAINNFKEAGIEASFRLGNGFEVLGDNEAVDVAVIAGIGGKLITDILKASLEKTFLINKLVLSTNVGMHNVRRWAEEHDYLIVDDQVLQENDKFYEVVTLVQSTNEILQKSFSNKIEEEVYYLFGNQLLQKMQLPIYSSWIQFRIELLQEQIEQMEASKSNEVKVERAFLVQLKEYLEVLVVGK